MREKGIKFAQELADSSVASSKKAAPATKNEIVDQLFVPSTQEKIQRINSDSEVEESEIDDNGEPDFEKVLFLKGLELQRIKKTNYSLLGAIGKITYVS
jgi:hypothetical protein